uniref:ras and Rab interactor 2-like n=1 Tax=Myxine glutinosa TaxID=7769 RepID=UPI00358DF334
MVLQQQHGHFDQLVHYYTEQLNNLKLGVQETTVEEMESMSTPDIPARSSSLAPQPPPRQKIPHLSLMDRLSKTHKVWFILGMQSSSMQETLGRQPSGVFMIFRKIHVGETPVKVLSVSLSDKNGFPNVQDFPVVEMNSTFSLEGSALAFDDMFQLLVFYTLSKDILPIHLRLPRAIQNATDQQQLEDIAQKGKEFWSSCMNTPEPATDEQPCDSMDAMGRFKQPVCLSKLTLLSGPNRYNRDSGISIDDNEPETPRNNADTEFFPRTDEQKASPNSETGGSKSRGVPKSDDGETDDLRPSGATRRKTTLQASEESSDDNDDYLDDPIRERSQGWPKIPRITIFPKNPKNKVKSRIQKLAANKSSHFGGIVSEYIKKMAGGLEGWTGTGEELLVTVRELMNQLKIYLVQSNELTPPIESIISNDCIDEVLEDSLERCILKQLHEGLIGTLVMEANNSTTIMARNCTVTCNNSKDLKLAGTILSKIERKLIRMQDAYAPSRKVYILLKICKIIYKSIENPKAGADEFLPVLMYVLAKYYSPRVEAEFKYTLHLLNEEQWGGEGAYYLTSVHGAFQLLHNLQEQDAQSLRQSEKCNLGKWQAYHRQLSHQGAVHGNKPQRAFLLVTCGSDPESPVQMIEADANMSVLDVSKECAHRMRLSSSVACTYGLYINTAGGNLHLLRATDTIMNIEEMNNCQPDRLLFRQLSHSMYPRPSSIEIPPSRDAMGGDTETTTSPTIEMTAL